MGAIFDVDMHWTMSYHVSWGNCFQVVADYLIDFINIMKYISSWSFRRGILFESTLDILGWYAFLGYWENHNQRNSKVVASPEAIGWSPVLEQLQFK